MSLKDAEVRLRELRQELHQARMEQIEGEPDLVREWQQTEKRLERQIAALEDAVEKAKS